MSEYLEALSRLNAPERTPGVYIPRSLFMMPRRDTPYHKNRIMAETLNSPLPKYSIPQMFFLPHQDNDTYEFELDKQFTLAQGGRKSIAIRKIHVNVDDYNNFIRRNSTFNINIRATFGWCDVDDQGNEGPLQLLTIDTSEVLQATIDSLKDITLNYFINAVGFQNLLRNEFNDNTITVLTVLHVGDDITIRITGQDKLIGIDEFECNITTAIDIRAFIDNPVIKYSIDDNNRDLELDFNCLEPYTIENIFVCSSLNPWSPKNIIGDFDTNFSMLNRIFPYDNQQTFKIWFTTDTGKRFPNHNWFTGYIELELIIDNENNFAIDE